MQLDLIAKAIYHAYINSPHKYTLCTLLQAVADHRFILAKSREKLIGKQRSQLMIRKPKPYNEFCFCLLI